MLVADDSARRRELEAAFPWARHLPPLAQMELMNTIDSYRAAAAIYKRQAERAAGGPTC